mgnify:CR=1 FL=1
MEAKHILLIANGEGKADALYQSLFGPITPQVPHPYCSCTMMFPLLPMKLHYHVSLKKILFNIYCFCKGVPYDYKKRTFWEESGSFLTKDCILIAIPIASQWMLLIRQMTPLLMHPVCM